MSEETWSSVVFPQGPQQMVVLDRVEDRPQVDYCIHGKVTCISCDRWCWLGETTYNMVTERIAAPLCMPCAKKYASPSQRLGNAEDHKRADGPHS
jgi:hypothetical protein